MGARQQRRHRGGSYHLILAIGLLIALGLLGGASRADELQQFFIRAAAILAIAAALWPLDLATFRDARPAAVGLSLLILLLLAQLLPLPASWWARMPGHDLYSAIAEQTRSAAWRPWTISPDLTLNSLASLLPATAIGLIALALDFRGRLLLARILIAIAGASALLGLMQFAAGGTALHLFRTTSEDSAVGLFANRNHQAAFMACALPIGAALAAIRTQRKGVSTPALAVQLATAVLLLMGLGATGSRMGLLIGSLAILAALVIYFMTLRSAGVTEQISSRTWLGAATGSCVALTAVAILVWRGGAVARLSNGPIDQSRAAALGPMLAAARAFFPFGAGFGTFDPVYRRFEPDFLLSTIYLNQAHNEPIQLMIEGGLFALILLLIFLVWWARAAIRAVRPSQSSSRRALAMAMLAVTLILMLSSLVDYPLRTPLLGGLFALACVELLRSSAHAAADRKQ